jgi:site-specific DNA-methyltransferase (adenine-specific)
MLENTDKTPINYTACCTLADLTHQPTNEAQKIKNAKRGGISFFCIDNIEFMKTKPGKYYDLAIVDPPYGGNDAIDLKDNDGIKKQATKRTQYRQFENTPPTVEYFEQLKRVSKEQIIWGVNFYKNFDLTGGRLCWDKKGTAFGRAELAYLSMTKSVNIVEIQWNGMLQYNMKDKEIRIHPTQKPIMLYRWLLQNYAKQGMKILDTHGGSMTIAKACDMEGFELDICEIDEEYFNNGLKAYDEYKRQTKLF